MMAFLGLCLYVDGMPVRTCMIVLLALLLGIPMVYSTAQEPAIEGDRLDVDIYGNIFVLDAERNTLRQYTREQKLVREVGGPGWQDAQFDRPKGIWARNGIDIFVADFGNHRIQRFDRTLSFVSSLSTRSSDNPDERFGYPTDVAISRLGELFICDGENSRMVKVNRLSQVERTFGGFGAGEGSLRNPERVEIGPGDNLYVQDGDRIVEFDAFGNFVENLSAGVFKKPSCLFADPNGIVVVDDTTLYCFDSHNRPEAVLSLPRLLGGPVKEIRSIALSIGNLYILTSTGLSVIPDPRGANPAR